MKRVLPLIITILVFSIQPFLSAEIVEKIYAVVNGEIITYSELRNAEAEMTRLLSEQYKDKELVEQVTKMKAELLDRLIEQKIILSYAREKKFDVDGDIEMIIQNLKKQNNLKTDEELQRAIASQGLNYQEWKKQLKESRIQQRFIYQEIGSQIKIDNSDIMSYYKGNIKEFTTPHILTLNCIYLDKPNHPDAAELKTKKEAISAALKPDNFEEVAKVHSELPGENEDKYKLGEFKKGELDAKIEDIAIKLKKDQYSSWIETENGWYLVKMVKFVEPQLVEYKKVRTKIETILRNKEQDGLMTDYIKKLRKESHIKIYEKS